MKTINLDKLLAELERKTEAPKLWPACPKCGGFL